MSATVVNLRQARKQKARETKAQSGAENRRKFGRTKTEKSQEEAETALQTIRFEGHKLTSASPSQKSDKE
ncbi:hypothetical protein PsAD2_00750 [Pseudovibrio axinellae]|uniref:DUF4169 domain-containing protein n=1 Tax=Pseudovibrio axinellae TaxID=989403 RepID=A0A166AR87_9HYPH|nr:DUF4169 family protein [Pseudovibrio axinellae]KZL21455.1 hypothetical protein PsAD2_00750 [Pseudovibrio axinellae]SER05930.1 protein of unknown function [Pseudovibrio axinellae]